MEIKDYISNSIKSNDLKSKSSSKIERLTYIEREHLSKLKKQLADKVLRDLANKYYIIIKDKNYNIKNFYFEFEKELEKSYDFNNPDYKIFFRKIENIFLNRMNRLEDKNIFNSDEVIEKNFNKGKGFNNTYNKKFTVDNKNFSFGSSFQNKQLENLPNENYKQAFVKDQIKMFYSPKREELKRKQNEDEWAKLANKDYYKFLEENENRKKKLKNSQAEYSNILHEQMKEKEILKKIESENEKKFYDEVFLKNLQDQDKIDLEKTENYKKKCIENKLASLREIRGEKL